MKKITGSITYGSDHPTPDNFRDSNPWTIELRYDGRKMTTPFYTGSALGEPSLADVMECLASDASTVENSRGFEDWAEDLGYDTDSRSAEATYQACVKQTDKLRRLLGSDFEEIVFTDEDTMRKYVKEPNQ